MLGARRGFLALLLFLALVAVGLPRAGRRTRRPGGVRRADAPASSTAGRSAAFVIGLLTERFWRRYNLAWALVANLIGGIAGHLRDRHPVPERRSPDVPLSTAFTGSLAFVPG